MKLEYHYEDTSDRRRDRRYVLKTVFRRSGAGHLRLARLSVERPRQPADGAWLYRQVSVGLAPRLLGWRKELFGRILWLLGLRLHFSVSYGGRLAE